MSYCFLDYAPARGDHGVAPDCPEGVGFLLLADLPEARWGLFETTDVDTWSPESPVSEELAGLIESGKRYPPALALAREEVREVFGDHRPSQSEVARAYGAALRNHLARQEDAPYVLAPALKEDVGTLTVGEWYWLLRISGTPSRVSWVSDDFRICTRDVNDFDLTGQQLKRLAH